MKKPKKLKPIIGWAVYFNWMGTQKSKWFSGDGFDHRARIFPTKKLALQAWPNEKPFKVKIIKV